MLSRGVHVYNTHRFRGTIRSYVQARYPMLALHSAAPLAFAVVAALLPTRVATVSQRGRMLMLMLMLLELRDKKLLYGELARRVVL